MINGYIIPLCIGDSWTFNMVTHQWKQLHFAHAVPRLWHTACVAPDGDVIVFGGCSNNILNQEEVNVRPIVTIRTKLSLHYAGDYLKAGGPQK